MASADWTPKAESDIEDVYSYIAHKDFRRSTAKVAARRIRQVCNDLATSFAAGHVLGTARPNFGDSYRIFSHERWVIIFRPIDGGIEVLRVVDGSRDYDKLFGG